MTILYRKVEFHRRLDALQRRRVEELVGLGIPRREAKAQVSKEFGAYDRMIVDEQGRIGFEGLDLSDALVPRPGSHTSSTAPRQIRVRGSRPRKVQ